MSEDLVNIEVDGRPLKARKGQMLIQATDAAGIYVPRFCYHEKLSVAANCRMCLVEVEKAPKPLPACATPVAEGMKAFTRSPRAIAAQKATMEFLLINHPLDCPICDQGGECELQDLAQGFGSSVSRFTERKRVVKDKNLGPLISTDMTRCIHCTRCVRFTAEIAGKQELGTTGRGEDMEIGTWIERSVDHELSGNVIDLCPVGALNSKPFRHRGRSWEMTQHELVSPHDGIGSNLYGHVLRGQLMRVVPRPNEEINETWISDRDRFSYEGVYSADRLRAPMLRRGGQWQEVSWEDALTAAAQGLKDAVARDGASSLGVIGTPGATLEELYLLARLARGLGCANVDTRLRQLDFRGQDADPAVPGLGMALGDVDGLDALLVVGSHLRHEAPILAHRVRKAATRNRARVSFVNPARYEWLFPVANEIGCGAEGMLGELAGLLKAAAEAKGVPLPANVAALASGATTSAAHRDVVASLAGEGRRAVLLGALAMRHPAWADLRDAAAALAELTGATLSLLPEGANAAGAALAGALPHRGPAGEAVAAGLHTVAMLSKALPAYLLFGGVEPEADTLVPESLAALRGARFVVAATPYATETLKSYAHVLLPIGTFAETSGTYVNVEGRWQSFAGCVRPVGEARPGWKVLRVLGNLLDVDGFDYDSSEQVREELRARPPVAPAPAGVREAGGGAGGAVADMALYEGDAIVRRALSLQQTRDAGRAAAQG
ncbi:MAG: NADH-quinone oxidoreductase subunit NuoG [Steroidobacteraceae bacterium]|jgi:NADH-quinone oxidoreductase subunit G|nr:NADH-quinone oxidoreductase subunit NuoG [Steroidobacteraceae bacterium]